jgi:hypothetical protein
MWILTREHAISLTLPCLPTALQWRLDDGTSACFIAEASLPIHAVPDIYCINLLTGAVLLNGVPPSRLPAGILDHPDYAPLFGSLEFDVTNDLRTRHAIHGRFYRFQTVADTRLVVYEMRTVSEEGEVLELLPGAQSSPPCPQTAHKKGKSISMHMLLAVSPAWRVTSRHFPARMVCSGTDVAMRLSCHRKGGCCLGLFFICRALDKRFWVSLL